MTPQIPTTPPDETTPVPPPQPPPSPDPTDQKASVKAASRRPIAPTQPAAGVANHARHHVSRHSQA